MKDTSRTTRRSAFALRRAVAALAFFSAAASLPLILAAASADEPVLPVVAGAPKARALQNVTSFGKKDGHPEWFVLRSETGKSTTFEGKEVDQPKTPIDTTPMKFGHAKHMSSGAVRNLLKSIKDGQSQSPTNTGRAVHIEFDKDEEGKETLGMSCTFCHENDSAGRYMKPIKFETHCADCHSTNLGVVSVTVDKDADDKPVSALKLEKKMWNPELRKNNIVVPDQIPHGSSQYVADMIEKQIGQWALASPPVVDKAKYDEWMKQREGAAAPEKPSGGRGRGRSSEAKPEDKPAEKAEEKAPDEPPPSGRRRSSSSDSATPAAPPAPKVVAIPEVFADTAMLNEWKAKLRDAALTTLRGGDHCGYCHTNIKDGKDTKSFFEVSNQKIPEVWLSKSFFKHAAHATMSCESCHALAKFPKPKDASDSKAALMFEWANETARVMLPGIDSCRECHAKSTPTGSTGAPSECVVCHTYHAKLPSSVQGKQTIMDVIKGGAKAGASEAAPAKPAAKAPEKTPEKTM